MSSFEQFSFYRGLSDRYEIAHPTVHKTRKNRCPRDMRQDLHTAADDWFLGEFGVRYRSQSIFLISKVDIAATYSATPLHVARIVPLGGYRYCWSSQLNDLLEICLSNPDIDSFNSDLASAHYREDCLEEAHRLGHEVMLFCESYICIPVGSTVYAHE